MNGRFQMQGGKNWFFSEVDQCKPVLLGLSLTGNPVKPVLSLYGTEWRERGYGLRPLHIQLPCNPQAKLLYKNELVSMSREIKIKKNDIGHQIFKIQEEFQNHIYNDH
jgi:hypothetical protein